MIEGNVAMNASAKAIRVNAPQTKQHSAATQPPLLKRISSDGLSLSDREFEDDLLARAHFIPPVLRAVYPTMTGMSRLYRYNLLCVKSLGRLLIHSVTV